MPNNSWGHLVRNEVASVLEQFLPDIKILSSEEGILALEKSIIFVPIIFANIADRNDDEKKLEVTILVKEATKVSDHIVNLAVDKTIDRYFDLTVKMSDVQKTALNAILSVRKISYNDLATEAFIKAKIKRPIPSITELSYDDAVVIIKYGNEKYRRR